MAQTTLDETNLSAVPSEATDEGEVLEDKALNRGHTNNKDNVGKDNKIVERETRVVWYLRGVLFFVLIGATLGMSLTAFYYIRDSQEDDFERMYESDTEKIILSVVQSMTSSLAGVENLVVGILASATLQNQSFPTVNIPSWSLQAAKMSKLSRTVYSILVLRVKEDERQEFEQFMTQHNQWVWDAWELQQSSSPTKPVKVDSNVFPNIFPGLFSVMENDDGDDKDRQLVAVPRPPNTGPYFVISYQYPVYYSPFSSPYFVDIANDTLIVNPHHYAMNRKRALIARFLYVLDDPASKTLEQMRKEADPFERRTIDFVNNFVENPTEPAFFVHYPIFDNPTNTVARNVDQLGEPYGTINPLFFFRGLLDEILPERSQGIVVVVESECGQIFTYQINGPGVVYLGNGDHHDSKYNYKRRTVRLADLVDLVSDDEYTGLPVIEECPLTFHIYPSQTYEDITVNDEPVLFTVLTALIFIFTSTVFLLYDCFVEKRQIKVLRKATKSAAIVSSLFPDQVRSRLFGDDDDDSNTPKKAKSNAPVADLYPEATIMFMDIKGFTAWSSVRQPSQVFVLLETVYGAFDKIAQRLGVFKVETIGDSYLAVAGLPTPRKDHAVVMARFSQLSLHKMNALVQKLQVTLGPDTVDLQARFGLHSGPVTAGVLRGERARFQLFGDTVNTASRMESNGKPGRIQASQATADCLIAAGKEHWLTPREDLVQAKGKGLLQTYWVTPTSDQSTALTYSEQMSSMSDEDGLLQRYGSTKDNTNLSLFRDRQVKFKVEGLIVSLKKIVASRQAESSRNLHSRPTSVAKLELEKAAPWSSCPLEQVVDCIDFSHSRKIAMKDIDTDSVVLAPEVVEQLNCFITGIASMYRDNPFHNLERAAHVFMSLGRVCQQVQLTYGPVIEFACLFAALIQGVDHPGLTNKLLERNNAGLFSMYKGRSVAEQNSFVLAWQLWMDDKFKDLRGLVCPTEEEAQLFRQVVINIMIATDVQDLDMRRARDRRWEQALDDLKKDGDSIDAVNFHATLVLELIMQAAVVAHMMQHWHVYRKWNERWFAEVYKGFKEGKDDQDPSKVWYEGELAFFDEFVIPLAEKLVGCKVVGGTGSEYVTYAQENRAEWAQKGHDIVIEMLKSCNESNSS